MKVGDLVKGKLWGELGIITCVPPMPSMVEVCWTGEKPRKQKHLSGELEVLNEKTRHKRSTHPQSKIVFCKNLKYSVYLIENTL